MQLEQIPSGSMDGVDPATIEIVNAFRATGANAWVGFPPEKERALLRAEKEDRDFQRMKKRAEAAQGRLKWLEEKARDIARRNRQVD